MKKEQHNAGGELAFQKTNMSTKEAFDVYDRLPAEVRKVLQNAPYNVHLNVRTPQGVKLLSNPVGLRRTIRHAAVESALKTYGRTYPVALIKV